MSARPWTFVAECAPAGVDPTGQVTNGRVMLLSTMVSGRLKLRKVGKQQFHDLYLPGVDGRQDVYTTEDIPETVTGQRTSLRRIWLDHIQPNAPGSNRPRKSMDVHCFRLARFQYLATQCIVVKEPFLILEAMNAIGREGASSSTIDTTGREDASPPYRRIGIGSTAVQYWNTEQSVQQKSRPIENVVDLNAFAAVVAFPEAEKKAFWESFRGSFEKGLGTEVNINIV